MKKKALQKRIKENKPFKMIFHLN